MEQQKRVPLTEEQKREKVLRSFVKDGRITSMPVKASKRRVILEYVAGNYFEKDRVYAEREVNTVLAGIFEDYCTLRRELVDAGLMTRSAGEYRRA
ncbi:MAG TPA: DUF2087 domain-containing protein [Clostridia bacterium]|nr:DUF2087 domain-containing protein [Clostridia bacterium]